MDAYALWQEISHSGYFILTIVGSIIVLAIVYRQRRRAAIAYRRRAKGEEE
jgi:hypothetical protein